jgi:hypothetical protein
MDEAPRPQGPPSKLGFLGALGWGLLGGVIGAVIGGLIGSALTPRVDPNDFGSAGTGAVYVLGGGFVGLFVGAILLPLVVSFIRRGDRARFERDSRPPSTPQP